MHITFLQSDSQAAGRPASGATSRRAASCPDSLYFSIAIAAACLWLALSVF